MIDFSQETVIFCVFRLLRSANYYLNKDIKDKCKALGIDNHCAMLHNESPEIYYAPNAVKIQSKYKYHVHVPVLTFSDILT